MGQAPRVGVEHRDDREDDIGFAHAQRVGEHRGHGVQHDRPVRVDDAFGIARGAARVHHRCRLVLVAWSREFDGRCGPQQLVVVVDGRADRRIGSLSRAVVHHDDVLDGGERRDERPQQRGNRSVDEDHFVLCVVDDVGQLLGKETYVERVGDAPATGWREVQLEMAGRVPREGGDAPGRADAEHVERVAEAAGAIGPLTVGRALLAARRGRDDLLVREQLLRPIEHRRHRQWRRHHQAVHRVPLALVAYDSTPPRSSDQYFGRVLTRNPIRKAKLAPTIVTMKHRWRPSRPPGLVRNVMARATPTVVPMRCVMKLTPLPTACWATGTSTMDAAMNDGKTQPDAVPMSAEAMRILRSDGFVSITCHRTIGMAANTTEPGRMNTRWPVRTARRPTVMPTMPAINDTGAVDPPMCSALQSQVLEAKLIRPQ